MNQHEMFSSFNREDIYIKGVSSLGKRDGVAKRSEIGSQTVDELTGNLERREEDRMLLQLRGPTLDL